MKVFIKHQQKQRMSHDDRSTTISVAVWYTLKISKHYEWAINFL